MELPKEFIAKITGAFGEAGTQWLSGLEGKLNFYAAKWNLELGGPAGNLTYNYVAKAVDDSGRQVVLKLGVPGKEFQNEITALQLYSGDGCAMLLKEDGENGAMLLEQLVPGKNLSEIEDEEQVTKQFTSVWKSIRRPVPETSVLPSIKDWGEGFDRYLETYAEKSGPLPPSLVMRAKEFLAELNEPAKMELLHGDLHHENILYSQERGWLAIDPKGVVGNPYFDLISFLFNHLHEKPDSQRLLSKRVNWICESLSLQKNNLLKAGIVMAVLSIIWSIEDHSEWEPTYRCVEWFEELLQESGKDFQA
ncbi:aminoglycoside phosphotransferase family protein [Bacillus sp. B-jedd]|uniref:aminoglycoside phosphotransferase family protein n=1 Tax=Bacillus sp. B-jedd TaxID=1476857 RepID=UPI000515676E|nr:aminoglycoside phosphotransferase family protein [Bacillus sp. B-jedd]CEG27052.1 hydroxyurea antibiotic resistance kinase, putative [Bacillus sp. B-jedd]